MANTPNLDLAKPAGTDKALVSVINSNSDKIDAGFGSLSDQIGSLIHMTNFKPTTDADGDAFLSLTTTDAIIVGVYPVRTGEDGTYGATWFLMVGGNTTGTAFGFKAYNDAGSKLANQKVSVNVYWISASHFSNQ